VTISSKKCFPKNFAGKNYNGISFQNLTRSNRNDNCEYIYYSLLVRLGCLAMILQKLPTFKTGFEALRKIQPKKEEACWQREVQDLFQQ